MTESESYNSVGGKAPCPCGSGKRFKRCCGDGTKGKRRVWLFDHPKNPDLWDTLAINREHAEAAFRMNWEEKKLLGQLSPDPDTFKDGLIYPDGEKPEAASEVVQAEAAALTEAEDDPSEAWKAGSADQENTLPPP